MKKNKMMRLASSLLVAVLLTSSVISGTFAKYVTEGSANDTARVAKWGVKINVTGDEAFATNYENDVVVAVGSELDTNEVRSSTGAKLVAPGTEGTLGTIGLTGTPEVMVEVKVNVDLELTGWKDKDGNLYCPLVFTVGATPVNVTGATTVDEIEEAVEKAVLQAMIEGDGSVDANGREGTKIYNARTDLSTTHTLDVSWEWEFSTSDENDVKDTFLGDQAALGNASTVSFDTTVTVTQVD